MQPRFVAALLRMCAQGGIQAALDTCGYSPPDVLSGLLELSDMALLDLKMMDEREHRRLTGVDLAPVLHSARMLAESGKPIWIRTPIIPGCTDSPENIAALASFLRELGGVERWDLLAFNNTCGSKYARLDMVWELEGAPLKTEDEMKELAAIAEGSGVEKVAWSGVTRRED